MSANIYSDPNYDPGFLNTPGKGQSVQNPLAPCYYYTLGVSTDATIYENLYVGLTINVGIGITWGFGTSWLDDSFFRITPPGRFESNVEIKGTQQVGSTQRVKGNGTFEQNVRILGNLRVRGSINASGGIEMDGVTYKPATIQTDSGPMQVLAAL